LYKQKSTQQMYISLYICSYCIVIIFITTRYYYNGIIIIIIIIIIVKHTF